MNSNPAFIKLLKLRSRVRFTLTALLIAAHAFFVGGIAFYRGFFAQPISEGSALTVGIVAAVVVIVTMIVLEWVYIFISQRWLDPMQQRIANGEGSD